MKKKHGETLYSEIATLFDSLPIAGIVRNEQGGWFCIHGGISPQAKTLEEIAALDRFLEPENDSALLVRPITNLVHLPSSP